MVHFNIVEPLILLRLATLLPWLMWILKPKNQTKILILKSKDLRKITTPVAMRITLLTAELRRFVIIDFEW